MEEKTGAEVRPSGWYNLGVSHLYIFLFLFVFVFVFVFIVDYLAGTIKVFHIGFCKVTL